MLSVCHARKTPELERYSTPSLTFEASSAQSVGPLVSSISFSLWLARNANSWIDESGTPGWGPSLCVGTNLPGKSNVYVSLSTVLYSRMDGGPSTGPCAHLVLSHKVQVHRWFGMV